MEDTRIDPQLNPVVPGSNGDTPSHNEWVQVVEKIRAGDPAGMEELYGVFSKGIRFFLCRQVGAQNLDDKVHDTFVIVAQAIQRGELREPERLMGFVRTVVRRQVAAHIDGAVELRRHHAEFDPSLAVADRTSNPEQKAIAREYQDVAMRILRSIPQRDREILSRFYLDEQTPAQICGDMDLTDTQFRLIKSRAKARFGELGRRRLERRGVPRLA